MSTIAERPKVLFYGDSLVLAGLRVTLAGNANLEVIESDGVNLSEQALYALQPNVVVFAVGERQPVFRYEIGEQVSGIMLVGIEASTNRVVIWSGRQLRALSISQLAETIGGKGLQPPNGEFGNKKL